MFIKTCFLLFILAAGCNTAQEKNAVTPSTDKAETFVDTILNDDSIPEHWKGKALAGIDFIATGNEPFWSFELDEESAMHFQTPDGLEMIAPAVLPEITKDGAKIFSADTETGSMLVQIENKLCINTMSGDSSAYTVYVTIKQNEGGEKKFRGCGTSLKN
ncbi:COG3650 family protein [Lacibacter sp. H407]|uniref:COG3650 family protein n=1 Tax=Lacibacter sp. H407 TaxID=3133423 RepID=UPI0030C617BB